MLLWAVIVHVCPECRQWYLTAEELERHEQAHRERLAKKPLLSPKDKLLLRALHITWDEPTNK